MNHLQIFLSAVTAEFLNYREKLRKTLARPNVSVHIQEDFIATGTQTLDKLDEYIRSCKVVIQIVGDMTGNLAPPSTLQALKKRYPDLGDRLPCLKQGLESGSPLFSYTQWEAYLAVYHRKKLFIATPKENAPRDANYVLDRQAQIAQQDHLDRLAKLGHFSEIKFDNADHLVSEIVRSSLFDLIVSLERRRHLLLAVAVVVAFIASAVVGANWYTAETAELDKVAVLPFENRTQDASLDNSIANIPIHLVSVLSREPNIIIEPYDSVRRLKDQKWTDIAQTLRARFVIKGSVSREKADDLPLVVTEIIDVKSGQVLDTESIYTESSEIYRLHNQIISTIATVLKLRLPYNSAGKPLGTKNPRAYDAYVRGYAFGMETTCDSNSKAIQFMNTAMNLDANYAEAHAELARLKTTRYYWNCSNDVALLTEAEHSAGEAIKLNDKLPEAHYALGYVMEAKGKRIDAISKFRDTVELAPNFVRGLAGYARFSFYMSDCNRTFALLDKIATIDTFYNVHLLKAQCHFFRGRRDESLREVKAAEKMIIRNVDSLTVAAFVYIWLEEFDAAERVLGKLRQLQPDALSISEVQAWLYTARGDFEAARKKIDEILASRQEYGIYDNIATLYAKQGDGEMAIKYLDKAVKGGAPNYAWYNSDFFKSVKDDPRYQAIMKTLDDEYRPFRSKTN